jgi:hypothetical protein
MWFAFDVDVPAKYGIRSELRVGQSTAGFIETGQKLGENRNDDNNQQYYG